MKKLTALFVFLSASASFVQANDVQQLSESYPFVFLDFTNSDADSIPLNPRDYYPLGTGIRKGSEKSLVPFCVAISPGSKACARIQYFEVEKGRYVDSDRAVDTNAGAPADRVTGQQVSFHGVAVGAPLSGYLYSGGGFEFAKNDFIRSFRVPESIRFVDLASAVSIFGEDLGMGGNIAISSISGGMIGFLTDRTGESWSRVGKGAVIGAVAPVAVYGVISSASKIRRMAVSDQLRRKDRRVKIAFNLSKSMSENWLLIQGRKVSAKTYDAFVEFLKSEGIRK